MRVCSRWLSNCSRLVGRPVRFAGSTTVEAFSQLSTSSRRQKSRRDCGIFDGRGMRCRYFAFVAQVRIVVTALPMIWLSCSTKMMSGSWSDVFAAMIGKRSERAPTVRPVQSSRLSGLMESSPQILDLWRHPVPSSQREKSCSEIGVKQISCKCGGLTRKSSLRTLPMTINSPAGRVK
jgi:hypothetical protein